MKIKIFVSHHKDGYIYEDKIFQPIHLGKAVSDILRKTTKLTDKA